MCFYLIFYALSSFFEHRNPNANISHLILGVLFALGCATIFLIHGVKLSKNRDVQKKSLNIYKIEMIFITIILLYGYSYFSYLKVGQTIGSIIGALAGFYLFSRMKLDLPAIVKKYLSMALIGLCLFFVLQDVCFDTLIMASKSLFPRIEKGQKVLINKLAFGLHMPFYSTYIIKWNNPRAGDLIIFLLKEKYLINCKEFSGFEGEDIIVKDNRKTETIKIRSILGKVII
jgi:signal peptidase I